MTDRGHFNRTEFGSDGEWQSPEEAIRDRHNPEIAYHHIVKLAGSIDAGLDNIPDEKKAEAITYATVDLFRATVQYVEEFGTYMYSEIKSDENFIELLIRTSAGNLEPFFENCRGGELDAYLAGEGQEDAATFIDRVFGYEPIQSDDVTLHAESKNAETLDDETLNTLIQNSEAFIESELQAIATYYLNVREAYNAVKHGNRVMVNDTSVFAMQPEHGSDTSTFDTASLRSATGSDYGNNEGNAECGSASTVDTDLTSNSEHDGDAGGEMEDPGENDSANAPVNVSVDDPYISFLCKTTGDEGGDPYILTVPASFLERWSLDIADRVHRLYQHVYESTTTSTGEGTPPEFYKHPDEQQSNDDEYYLIQNPDSTVIIPSDAVPDTIREFELEDGATVELVCSVSHSSGTVKFDFALAAEPTEDHPIRVTGELETIDRVFRELGTSHFHFSVEPKLLTVGQYLDLLEIRESDGFTEIEVDPPGQDDVETGTVDTPFEGIQVPEPTDREFIEYLHRIEQATQTRIPFPPLYTDEHYNLYEEYQDADLDRETAEEFLVELHGIGEITGHMQVVVRDWAAPLQNIRGNADRDPEQEERLLLSGARLELDVDGVEQRRGDDGETWEFAPAPSTFTVDEAIEAIESDGIDGVTELRDPELDSSEASSWIGVKIRFGERDPWGTFDGINVGFFTEPQDE